MINHHFTFENHHLQLALNPLCHYPLSTLKSCSSEAIGDTENLNANPHMIQRVPPEAKYRAKESKKKMIN